MQDGVTYQSANYIEIDYKTTFPLESIYPGERIYIVDFSIEPAMMEKLLSVTQNVTWIDHHKTAIEKYDGFPFVIRGVRYDGYSGAMLTYCYLHCMTQRGEGDIKPFNPSMIEDAPEMTKLIDDWDCWKFNYGNKTRYFQIGSTSLDLSPESKEWIRLMSSLDGVIHNGKIIMDYRDQWAKDYINGLGYIVKFDGYTCFAVNLGRCNSEYFKSLNGQYDIYMPYVSDGKKYTVSLYSTLVDVSIIAKKYGGGGHKGAAGFVCSMLPFSCKDEIKTIKQEK